MFTARPSPFAGYRVTAYTNDEEDAVGLRENARWTVEDELVKMAPTNIIDSLNALPQFFGNNTYQQALGGQSPSGSQVNLRGANTSLGISRTLVLLDGVLRVRAFSEATGERRGANTRRRLRRGRPR